MAVTNVVTLELKLSDGSKGIITLPAPVNNTLTDEDSGETLYNKIIDKIKAVYETEQFATVVSATFVITKTTRTVVAEDVTGTGDD